MGDAAAFLLGARDGRVPGAPVHVQILLRLRVHGTQWATRHHAAHRQDIPHSVASRPRAAEH